MLSSSRIFKGGFCLAILLPLLPSHPMPAPCGMPQSAALNTRSAQSASPFHFKMTMAQGDNDRREKPIKAQTYDDACKTTQEGAPTDNIYGSPASLPSQDMTRYEDPAADKEDKEPPSDKTEPPNQNMKIETIQDANGNTYSKKDIARLILSFKKDSRCFFWGDLQQKCNRENRTAEDSWYPWSNELMASCVRHETAMRSLLVEHGHSKIQGVCAEVAGDAWNSRTTGKLKKLFGGLQQIQKLANSNEGMWTCWGRMRYKGMLNHKMRTRKRELKQTAKDAKTVNISEYLKYIDGKWKRYFDEMKDKKAAFSFYYKN